MSSKEMKYHRIPVLDSQLYDNFMTINCHVSYMNMDNGPVYYNEKGEVIIYDLRQPKYDEPQYYYDNRNNSNDQYYRQQMVAGRPVYVQTVIAAIGYGFLAACYAPEIILYAALITAGVCLLITVIACQPWIDITGWGVYLCVIGMVAMIFGLVVMIIAWTVGLSKVLFIVYASIMALVFSLYFMWTTQLILGGKKYEISPEEYVYGAIVLYVEVMTLFILIMQLCGVARN
ncbi:bax inhibitor-related [Holotrichia oblita]|uniref:Bax inhibitor-related n=1 Tax=Holotrichia oblita TaxID=644536 RepID=A0ACB9SZJ6_HOLOL|nr:bax inhibitor-related [Holotrichia oblita]